VNDWSNLTLDQKLDRLAHSLNFLAIQNDEKSQRLRSLEREVEQLRAELAARKAA
jgi:hypothetical protein